MLILLVHNSLYSAPKSCRCTCDLLTRERFHSLYGKTNIDPARQNVGDADCQGQGEPLNEPEGLGFELQVPIPLYLYI